MRLIYLATTLCLFALASCADPMPVYKPVTVDIPVLASCTAKPVVKPDFALAHVAASDGIYDKVKAALVEIDQRKAYEARLEAHAEACQ